MLVQSSWDGRCDLQLPSGSREWHHFNVSLLSRDVSSRVKEPRGWQAVALSPPAAHGLQCVTDLELAPPFTPHNELDPVPTGGDPEGSRQDGDATNHCPSLPWMVRAALQGDACSSPWVPAWGGRFGISSLGARCHPANRHPAAKTSLIFPALPLLHVTALPSYVAAETQD